MRIIILLLIIHIVFSQKTSPRMVYQDYMYANGCKNRLLNKIIASTIYKRNLNTNYNFLNTMIRQHMRQFSEEEILRWAASLESLSEHPLALAVIDAARTKQLILEKTDCITAFRHYAKQYGTEFKN